MIQVRIWDANTRSLLRMTQLDSPVSCVEYSPDGELLVVGFGHREGRGKTSSPSMSGGGSLNSGAGSSRERSEVKDDERGGHSRRPRSAGREGSNNVEDELGAKTGGFAVLNEADFGVVFEARDARKVRPRELGG